jgi:hypothetical protein
MAMMNFGGYGGGGFNRMAMMQAPQDGRYDWRAAGEMYPGERTVNPLHGGGGAQGRMGGGFNPMAMMQGRSGGMQGSPYGGGFGGGGMQGGPPLWGTQNRAAMMQPSRPGGRGVSLGGRR